MKWYEYLAFGIFFTLNIMVAWYEPDNTKPTFRTEVRQRLERIERKLDDLATNATGS